jgi:hypothetical protein
MKSHHMLPFISRAITVCAAVVVSRLAFATNPVPVPQEIKQFVEAGTHPVALGSADVNGDGRSDYVLILEKDSVEGERTLVILVRRSDHSLKLAVRNDTIVMCSFMQGEGGGIELVARHNTFKIRQTIGAGLEKGANILIFRYLKRERDWILTNFDRESFNVNGVTQRTRKDVSARHLSVSQPLPEEFEGGCHP